MSNRRRKCPKCDGVLKVKKNHLEGGFETHQVICQKCGLEGEVSLTKEFAVACFLRENQGQLVSLLEIEQTGGPSTNVMRWRIRSGYYPDVQMKKRGWKLPRETADRVVEEWKQRKLDLVPLVEVAVQCGLRRTSLNPQVVRGIIHATLLYNRWYVTKPEVERLLRYYSDTVTSSEAAEILGFSHRSYILQFSKEKLPYECLGIMRRFRREALQDFLKARSVSKVKQ